MGIQEVCCSFTIFIPLRFQSGLLYKRILLKIVQAFRDANEELNREARTKSILIIKITTNHTHHSQHNAINGR